MSALWGEMKVTARMPHAGKQSINSAITQDVKPCRTLLPSIDVCSVSGPPRFVTLIACISIQHAPEAQCKMESNWMPRRYAGRGGEGRGTSKQAAGVSWIDGRQRTKKSSHSVPLSAPFSRQNHLHLISDAWIQISKGWKMNTNSNLKFEVRKSELRLTTLVRENSDRRSGKVREFKSTRVQKLTKMQKKTELFHAHCVQQFKIFSACFARRLFVPSLLNLFRRHCF